MAPKYTLQLDPSKPIAPTRDKAEFPASIPQAKQTQTHPSKAGHENASIYFIGTATTVLEWEGIRILTDPNFLHAGDHVHLGPGVQGTRRTNPAIDLHELPHVDVVLLSHYHADHFDDKVEASLRRELPIVTTPHAKEHLHDKKAEGEKFTQVYDLDHFESAILDVTESATRVEEGEEEEEGEKKKKVPAIKVTGMPGKHVPPGPLATLNDLVGAVPPTNGWMIELGYKTSSSSSTTTTTTPAPTTEAEKEKGPKDSAFHSGYRIYISGDTLLVDDLHEIPHRYRGQEIDLMLIHLGGTTIPSASVPLLMVTMDATQGVKLMQLIRPDVTIPVHYDDYDVFLSPLEDFRKAVVGAGLQDRVVYLDRADEYRFEVRGDEG